MNQLTELTRRRFLGNVYTGLGGIGLLQLLSDASSAEQTCWMMGAGVKGGLSYGATDEFGRRAEVNPTTVWDFYATVLHLLGFEHEKLTWYHNGLDRRLTDVHGHVIKEILS